MLEVGLGFFVWLLRSGEFAHHGSKLYCFLFSLSHLRQRLLEDDLVSRGAAIRPLLSKNNIMYRLLFCGRWKNQTAEDWGKVISSDEGHFRLFGRRVRRLSSDRSTLKHLKTIHKWSCSLSRRVGSDRICPWTRNSIKSSTKSDFSQRSRSNLENAQWTMFFFQHDGAPCHNSKVIIKWCWTKTLKSQKSFWIWTLLRSCVMASKKWGRTKT